MMGVPGKLKQQRVEQLDAAAVVIDQRGEAAADADVDAHARVGRVGVVHVVALVVGDHLEGELVVVAKEEPPLAVVGDGRRLRHDVGDGQAVLLAERHVDARHQGEVEGHVALVAVAEVGADVGGPLVGLGENQRGWCSSSSMAARMRLDDGVGLGEVLAGVPSRSIEVGDGVHAQRVDAHVEPEAHGFEDLLHDERDCRS